MKQPLDTNPPSTRLCGHTVARARQSAHVALGLSALLSVLRPLLRIRVGSGLPAPVDAHEPPYESLNMVVERIMDNGLAGGVTMVVVLDMFVGGTEDGHTGGRVE